MFCEIYKIKSRQNLVELMPEKAYAYATRNVDNNPFLTLDATSSKSLSFLLQ